MIGITVLACNTEPTEQFQTEQFQTADLKGGKCSFEYPSTDKIYSKYQSTEKQSAEDVVLYALDNITYRWYPKNGKWKARLSMNELAWYTLYGKNADGEIVVTRLDEISYRFKITGDNGFVHEGCTSPDFGVTSYYGIKDLPDGTYTVEFLDFPTAPKNQFIKPSF